MAAPQVVAEGDMYTFGTTMYCVQSLPDGGQNAMVLCLNTGQIVNIPVSILANWKSKFGT